ncbi:cyclic nucleotide-gated ion channel [Fulvivirga sediminis]|uniref:Cyclic nucleotide-binding domain-containing protein n=1 Tax=Fulvivirga sediminis TaxID=2803949 RepID=A0A937K1V9_9BACT|nr:cyclic nucleotide-gated ion channel [Fulvivirga sediminis]MBL3657896.1 cyclic nucleotide-binding domain-containing protein [Fulvivirga sediminis]
MPKNIDANIFFIIWNVILALGAAILAILKPLDMVFYIQDDMNYMLWYWVANVIFILDIPISYFQLRYIQDDFLFTGDSVAKNYLHGWIIFDVFLAFPYGLFISSIPIRLIRVLKLLKIASLMRYFRSREVKHGNSLTIIFFFYWFILGTHWLTCGWLALRGVEYTENIFGNYLKALYWVSTTLTTVGYGDITPNTNAQYIYAICLQIMGVGVFGYIIGNIAGFLTRKDPATVRYFENMDRLSALVRYRSITKKLQREIHYFYTYQWRKRMGYDESSFLAGLPRNLQRELSLQLKRGAIEKIYLFKDANEAFITEIAMHLSSVVLTPDQVLFEEGDRGDGMYFVLSGELTAVNRERTVEYSTFKPGAFLGEIALFEEKRRTATIIAKDYCDLYKLDRNSFEEVILKFPKIASTIKQEAEKRHQENIEKEV